MKALGFNKFGDRDVLEELEVDAPVPGNNDVIIRMKYTSVNMLDILVRKSYVGLCITMPHILGADVSGEVEAVGKGVSGFNPGDSVIAHALLTCGSCDACLSGNEAACSKYKIVGRDMWGSYGELVMLPDSLVIGAPSEFSMEELACLPLSLATSWRALHTLAGAREGNSVIVRGTSGNVGIISTLLAKSMGLKVIALTRSKEKEKRLKDMKADLVINTNDADRDIVNEVRDFTGGGADFALESFGSTLEQSADMLHDGGKIILFGTVAGSAANIDVKKLYLRSKTVIGTHISSRAEFEDALNFVSSKGIKPIIGKRMSIKDAAEAHRMLESSEIFGKIVLKHDW